MASRPDLPILCSLQALHFFKIDPTKLTNSDLSPHEADKESILLLMLLLVAHVRDHTVIVMVMCMLPAGCELLQLLLLVPLLSLLSYAVSNSL